ncbi:uncharacterized protein LOC125056854 [Pieris napi]|uniref:uncharacterized protein LOC125056854 n=1 Tax=Pieris napi TaxID=78633 RepID=UPI001FB876DB|nr:uncharacterized protein LOC125056854 [Pieris napi]
MVSRWPFLIFVFFFVSFGYAEDTQPECGPYEMAKTNPNDCVADCCPIGENFPCPDPCPQGPCRCSLMSSRAINGTCISTRDCPPYPCGINEVYESCPVCSESCSNASPDGRRCRSRFPIRYVVICRPRCRCIDFHWRNKDGFCVPYCECPRSQGKE